MTTTTITTTNVRLPLLAICLFALATVCRVAAMGRAKDTGGSAYLFVYFTGNKTAGQQIHYAVSRNGVDFTPLNGGRPVISADTISLSGGVRDPHIIRGRDGMFYMVATDMDMERGKWSNHGIVMMTSRDMIGWRHHTVDFHRRYAGKAPSLANAVWAPQTIWDPEARRYMVYFSLHSEKDGPYPRDAVYYAYANKEFSDLATDPQPLFEYPYPTIDTDIVLDGSGTYHLFFNTWGGPEGLARRQFTFRDLHDQDSWTLVPGRMQPNGINSEGSCAYQLHDGRWMLTYDCYQEGYSQFCESDDLMGFRLVKTTEKGGFFSPRHGSVLRITAEEYDRLVEAYGKVVVNGVPWYDQNGNPVNAHGAGIIREDGRYWLFGEYKSDASNAFPGFGCYSSDDLVNWRFERVVLPVQPSGILGPNRVGERVKVMRCPKTGEYVMLMHADSTNYRDPHIGIATCRTINGDYKLRGTLQYKGKPIRRWDMGVFQDDDGKGYLLIHHGPIYRLSDDYLSVDTMVADVKGMGESPAMFKKDGMYYLLTSGLTSWERNDNFYFTAPSIGGPWTRQGLFCPEGTLTWNSQSTFVLTLPDGTPMYMGDRWSYPRQASAATYVWLPMQAEGTRLSIPEYWQAWDVSAVRRVDLRGKADHSKPLPLSSNTVGETVAASFKGTHVALVGESGPHGGYALVSVADRKGNVVYSSLIDFYSKREDKGIRVVTPAMPMGRYTVTVKVTGERSNWTDKTKRKFGTDDCYVNVSEMLVYR